MNWAGELSASSDGKARGLRCSGAYQLPQALLAERLVHGGDALAGLSMLADGVGLGLELVGRSWTLLARC